jgi:hypothetical protein
MNDLRKAAEMALEALEEYTSVVQSGTDPNKWHEVVDGGAPARKAIQALRQALDDKPPVKSYAGGKPNYCTPEQERLGGEWVPCVKLPVIVHVRNQRDGEAYISTREGITPVLPDDLIMRGVAGEQYPIGRELFERTYTFDVDAANMSQDRVDETAKDRLIRIMGTFDLATGHADTMEQVLDALEDELRDVLGHLRARREWVGLTDEEVDEIYMHEGHEDVVLLTQAKLKEKNA